MKASRPGVLALGARGAAGEGGGGIICHTAVNQVLLSIRE